MRAEAGVAVDHEADQRLRGRLAELAGCPVDTTDVDEVTVRAHAALASAGSDVVLATLEDAVGVRERPNLPGTVDERPNWRLALPATLDEIGAAGADRIAATMREARP